MVQTATGGGRRKRQKTSSTAAAVATLPADAGFEAPHHADHGDDDDEFVEDTRGLTRTTRRALLLLNPLVDASGKRKSKSDKTVQRARPPVDTLALSSRVRLDQKIAFYQGLVPGSTGTIVGFMYAADPTLGPVLPGADLVAALKSDEQPQLPLVLVQFDNYTGPSCHASLPRVVPIYATTSTIECDGRAYSREQLPLSPANAITVHLAQGTSKEEHVMSPPGGKYSDFARGLFYVALSRCELLSGLYLIHYRATREMFTKWRTHVAEIDAEYERLRLLPKWRALIHEE